MGNGDIRAVADGVGWKRQTLRQSDVEVVGVAVCRVATVYDDLAEWKVHWFTFRLISVTKTLVI